MASGGTFEPFWNSNYRLLWGTNFTMYVSRWMQMTTLSWFVLNLTDSAFKVGVVGFCGMAPLLFLGIFGGLLADKLNRKKLIVMTQFLTLAAASIMSIFMVTGVVEYWYAYIAILIPGVGWALDMPSRRSLILDVVGTQGITKGIALDSVGMHSSKMLGPAVAGAMIAFVGVSGAYVFLSVLIALGCFLVLKVSQSERPNGLTEGSDGETISPIDVLKNAFANLLEGIKYAFSNQVVAAIIVITIFMNLLLFPYMQMVTVVSKDILHVGPLLMGILMASDGFGAFLGSVGIASRKNMQYHGRIFLYGSMLSLTALLIFSVSNIYIVSLVLLFILGVGTAGFGTMQSAIVLLVSKPDIRGRALGVVTIAIGAGPIGALIVGAMAEWIGPSQAIMYNAIAGFVVVALSGIFMPAIRGRIKAYS